MIKHSLYLDFTGNLLDSSLAIIYNDIVIESVVIEKIHIDA